MMMELRGLAIRLVILAMGWLLNNGGVDMYTRRLSFLSNPPPLFNY